jgi:nucleotide-binding universal stress UspA family protein
MFKTILVAVDQSEAAAEALQTAIELAREDQATLVLVSVLDVSKLVSVAGYESPYPVDAVAMLQESNEQVLSDMKAECEKQGVQTETVFLEGDACDEILKAADDNHAGLICMGTHGRTGLSRLFVGSVCEGVLRRSNVPLLAIRPSTTRETAQGTAPPANASAAATRA